MRLHFLLTLAGLVGVVTDQAEPPKGPDPKPAVRLPVAPAPVAEPKRPTPPVPVSRLGLDQLYVIDSDYDLLVLDSPQGVVRVTEDAGPLRVRGRFVDGTGVETRTFRGKEVHVVEAVKTGKVELLVIPIGKKDVVLPGDIIRVTLDVDAGEGPRPPPEPKKPDDPEPKKPDEPSGPTAKRVVVVVVEESQVRTTSQGKVLADPAYRDWVKAGGHDLEILDKDDPVVRTNGYQPFVNRVGVPAVLVFDADRTGPQLPLREFRLPATAAEFLAETKRAVK
jgi:hypothetical protein